MTRDRFEKWQESRRREWFYICTGDNVPENVYRRVKAKRKLRKDELVTTDDIT